MAKGAQGPEERQLMRSATPCSDPEDAKKPHGIAPVGLMVSSGFKRLCSAARLWS